MSSQLIDARESNALEMSVTKPAVRSVNPILTALKTVASLKLTVSLFAISIILVFFGTVAQKNAGIWTVVDQYFWSWMVWIDVQLLLQFGQIFFSVPSHWSTSLSIPFPAGKTIGGLMFINLVSAHIVQLYNIVNVTAKQAKKGSALGDVLKVLVKRSGIYILHGGMLLLFVGEYVTREWQVEQNMVITRGGSATFSFDTRNHELAFIDRANPDEEKVTVIPSRMLKEAARTATRVSHPDIPVDVEVKQYFTNSKLRDLQQSPISKGENPATVGLGLEALAEKVTDGAGTDAESKIDMPSAYVTLYAKGTNEPLGTYLVTSILLNSKQSVVVDKQAYQMELRFKHYYKPYKVELTDFTFEEYIGTRKAKNYTSHVRLTDPETGEDRQIAISMNNPLRYRGETFFQSGFQQETTTTTLQVVRNPGWMLPYASCVMVSFGMLLHFSIGLFTFARAASGYRKEAAVVTTGIVALLSGHLGVLINLLLRSPRVVLPEHERPSVTARYIPWVALGMVVLYVGSIAVPGRPDSKYNLQELGRLPVVKDGRTQPLDTVARVQLRIITHREDYVDDADKKQPAIKWYLDTMAGTSDDIGSAGKYKIFRIENDRVLELVKLKPREGLRYSFDELRPQLAAMEDAGKKAAARDPKVRDLFDVKVLELGHHLEMFMNIVAGRDALILPADGKLPWRKPGEALEQVMGFGRVTIREQMAKLNLPQDPKDFTPEQQQAAMEMVDTFRETLRNLDPSAVMWKELLSVYKEGKPAEFNKLLGEFSAKQTVAVPEADGKRARFESYLNDTALYYHCTALYVLGFLLCAAGWVCLVFNPGLADGFRKAAFWVLLLTLGIHTFTLFSRMYLMDRPLVFVTNLYSSAVFIGWAAVALCLFVERIFPMSVGNAVASALGFGTSIIAHNLAASGDTLEMMQAVLDTNFWLATHVTTVTLGYSATYIAGFLGLIYVILGVATPVLTKTVVVGRGEHARPQEVGRVIGQILYGVVCLAVLLSFVGTVLGGIWADQSWGRFWGWDPKENGAVLIVIWNALILHSRWVGLVKDRGIAVLALVGNMITTWSWFGTNQLGVGLHAYGFSNALAFGCMVTWVLHAGFIGIGLIPKAYWMSFAKPTAVVAEPSSSRKRV